MSPLITDLRFSIVSLLYLIISSTLPLIIYNLLKVKFRKTDKNYLFYLSLLIFLSPFFRSSAVWLTNDNLALVFFALSIKYFFKIRNSNSSITKNHFYFDCVIIHHQHLNYMHN